MTINEAINKLRETKPNQFGDDVLVGWISDVERKIWMENIAWHDGAGDEPPTGYRAEDDLDTELLIPEPYSGIYIRYMEAQIDYYSGEYIRYSNSMTMYNVALSEYTDWYNRTHMPKQSSYIKI